MPQTDNGDLMQPGRTSAIMDKATTAIMTAISRSLHVMASPQPGLGDYGSAMGSAAAPALSSSALMPPSTFRK